MKRFGIRVVKVTRRANRLGQRRKDRDVSFRWYETPERRDAAMDVLAKKASPYRIREGSERYEPVER